MKVIKLKNAKIETNQIMTNTFNYWGFYFEKTVQEKKYH